MIELPDPPLRSGVLLLRPWRITDASELVEAWADDEIQRWTGVLEPRDLPAAERWIAGDEERRRRELSLDLVVDRDGEVTGEVGLSSIDRLAGTVEVGWWTAAAHRRRGVASTAASLLVTWARDELGWPPWPAAMLRTRDPSRSRGGPVLWSCSDVKRVL